MCELFAFCGKRKILLNDYLREFFSHGKTHPNGWGVASFHDRVPSVEKEPEAACESVYLKNKLRAKIEESLFLAHIRRATIGRIAYENCHPFVKRDSSGRFWTLMHNGTIFKAPILDRYVRLQDGTSDSERALMRLVDAIDDRARELGRALDDDERFDVLERAIAELADGNKLNMIIYDGERLYVHSNYADSLFVGEREDGVLFATVPLDREEWRPVPATTLCAYRDGELKKKGTSHGKIYVDNPDDMKFLFMDFAGL